MENIVSIMNVLDCPLEALALNYVSFGFLTIVSNLWTWLAVITAAVSFWRIRASGGSTTSCSVKSDPQPPTPACFDQSSNGSSSPEPANEPPASIPAPAPATSPLRCDVNDNGLTKGKFTMYYDDESEIDGELTVVKEWGYNYNGGERCGEWCERVMRMRMGDLGWYRCQDLTAINGNVVKLWDDECRSGIVW